ncbi:ABC transporter permease [Pseudarthrobacter sp. R1]|uniref:ABC transporter permease n=1 Tax=Pseudarthrobacter sp. R1 TaxID=2944934 RepID=UPI002109693D|nr:ABC transporter permease [Pseudarthrobacter sp. R1]MCQ6271445.1 ABC transporter permease [Pseudarthrobacter sp. R1]
MITYLLRRLGAGLVLIFVVTAVTFFLTYGADIPVARNILGPNASAEQVLALEKQLGLDQPILDQYFGWLAGVIQGDLGNSYFSNQPVAEALAARLPVTLSVVVVAATLTITLSVVLGVMSAARGGVIDALLQSISTIAYVFPGIVLGVALVYVFAINLQWVPAIGLVPFAESPAGWFNSVILPAIVLAIGGVAALASQIRGSLVDELERDYVKTLRSRGVSEGSILLKHALRNAAGAGLTTFSLQFITMFGAALFIEKIFALGGYGTYAYLSAVQGDLPAMLGVSLFGVGLVVVVNMLVDVAYGWLNPKARTS